MSVGMKGLQFIFVFPPASSATQPECCAWSLILPYVGLKDVVTMSLMSEFRSIVMNCVANGMQVHIDDGFLDGRNSNDRARFFVEIGLSATSLKLTRIQDNTDLETICVHFKNIRTLTLEDIRLDKNHTSNNYPIAIDSLLLIGCDIRGPFLMQWLKRLTTRLTLFHAKGSRIRFFSHNSGETNKPINIDRTILEGRKYTNEMSNFLNKHIIHDLTLNFDEFLDNYTNVTLRHANRLSISAQRVNIRNFLAPKLEFLSLDLPRWRELKNEDINSAYKVASGSTDTLKSVILPGCPADTTWLEQFPNLEHLTIREALETTEQQQLLRSLGDLRSNLKIIFTVNPNPIFNQIFRLNDDCLLKITSYVSQESLLALRESHQRFRNIFPMSAKVTFKHTEIDKEFLRKHPVKTSMDIYKDIGPGVKDLEVRVPQRDFLALLPHFTHIQELFLGPETHLSLAKIKRIDLFPKLASLSMMNCPPPEYLKRLFLHLDGTLKLLGGPKIPMTSVKDLHNLESLVTTDKLAETGLAEVFAKNKKLNTLRIMMEKAGPGWVHVSSTAPGKCWKIIAGLEGLRDLTVTVEEDSMCLNPRPSSIPLLKNVESFRIQCYDSIFLHTFLTKLGSQLKTLVIEFYTEYDVEECFFAKIRHLSNLEVLLIDNGPMLQITWNPKDICRLTTLKRLLLDEECPEVIMTIIKGLPRLEEMENRLFKVKDIRQELTDYLRSADRKLTFNKGEFSVIGLPLGNHCESDFDFRNTAMKEREEFNTTDGDRGKGISVYLEGVLIKIGNILSVPGGSP